MYYYNLFFKIIYKIIIYIFFIIVYVCIFTIWYFFLFWILVLLTILPFIIFILFFSFYSIFFKFNFTSIYILVFKVFNFIWRSFLCFLMSNRIFRKITKNWLHKFKLYHEFLYKYRKMPKKTTNSVFINYFIFKLHTRYLQLNLFFRYILTFKIKYEPKSESKVLKHIKFSDFVKNSYITISIPKKFKPINIKRLLNIRYKYYNYNIRARINRYIDKKKYRYWFLWKWKSSQFENWWQRFSFKYEIYEIIYKFWNLIFKIYEFIFLLFDSFILNIILFLPFSNLYFLFYILVFIFTLVSETIYDWAYPRYLRLKFKFLAKKKRFGEYSFKSFIKGTIMISYIKITKSWPDYKDYYREHFKNTKFGAFFGPIYNSLGLWSRFYGGRNKPL